MQPKIPNRLNDPMRSEAASIASELQTIKLRLANIGFDKTLKLIQQATQAIGMELERKL